MQQEIIIKWQQSILLGLILIVLFLTIFILVSFSELSEYKFVKTCDSFSSQKDAQNALPAHLYLDKNGDGIACNQLLK